MRTVLLQDRTSADGAAAVNLALGLCTRPLLHFPHVWHYLEFRLWLQHERPPAEPRSQREACGPDGPHPAHVRSEAMLHCADVIYLEHADPKLVDHPGRHPSNAWISPFTRRVSDPPTRTTLIAVRASIATAGGGGLGPLFEVLGELGVTDVWVLGNSIGDRYLFDPSPDMVVGVLNPRSAMDSKGQSEGLSNLDVMLRIGRAVERGVPAIVIVPPPLATPSPADGVAFAPCPIDHEQALSTHLWAFIATIGTRKDNASREPHQGRPRLDSARILNELQRLENISPLRFEEIVTSVLQQAGGAPLENEGSKRDRGVDFAFAPSDDTSSVILVEAKSGRLDEDRLRNAEEQLQSFVINRQAGLGMVVYHDSLGRQFPQRRSTPLIVRLSIEELVRQLETRSLTQVISDATAAAIDRM